MELCLINGVTGKVGFSTVVAEAAWICKAGFSNPFPDFWNHLGRVGKAYRLQPPFRSLSASNRAPVLAGPTPSAHPRLFWVVRVVSPLRAHSADPLGRARQSSCAPIQPQHPGW